MKAKTKKQVIKAMGYADDCSPNTIDDMSDLMEKYAKPYKKALKAILEAFPEEVLKDQMSEDYDLIPENL